jgi:hypothetical protein
LATIRNENLGHLARDLRVRISLRH